MSVFKLYEINEQLEYLLDNILISAQENDGVIDDEQLLALEEITTERNIKILDIARYIKTLNAKAEAVYTEAKKLQKRYTTYSEYGEKLRKVIQIYLKEGEKLEDYTTRIFWRKSDRVEIEDEYKIPDEYFIFEKRPSLQSIKKAIKQGVDIPGVKLTDHQNLQIN